MVKTSRELLTLPLGDHLEMLPTSPAADGVAAAAAAAVADADADAVAEAVVAANWCASRSAAGTAAATAVDVLLPVAVPVAVVLPTLEALLPLLPALLPPTVRLKFIDVALPRFSGVRAGVTMWGCGCVLDWQIPSLKIFTIKRKLHPLIGLDWIGYWFRFGLVCRGGWCCCSSCCWSYCYVDGIDYDYALSAQQKSGKPDTGTWKVNGGKVVIRIWLKFNMHYKVSKWAPKWQCECQVECWIHFKTIWIGIRV